MASRECCEAPSVGVKGDLAIDAASPEAGAEAWSKTSKLVIASFACCCVVVVAAVVVVFATGLLKDNSGDDLGIPALKPPVEQATPSGLAVSRRHAASRRGVCNYAGNDPPDCSSAMQIVKDRMFTSGPQDFTSRIGEVDDRMASLNSRAKETKRKCVDEAAVTWNMPAFPDGKQFNMKFSCQENLNDNSRIYFGKSGDWAYIAEIQNSAGSSSPTMAVLSKIKLDSTELEIWTVTSASSTLSVWFHIQATRSNTTSVVRELQVSFATNEVGNSGIGCGVRLATKSDQIFADGKFSDGGGAACSAEPSRDVCASGTTLDCVTASTCNNTAACTAAGLNASAFTVATLTDTLAGTFASTAASLCANYGNIPTLTGFNEEAD